MSHTKIYFFQYTTMLLFPIWVFVVMFSSYGFESQSFRLQALEVSRLKGMAQEVSTTMAGVAKRVAGNSAGVVKGEAGTLARVTQRAVKSTKEVAKEVTKNSDCVAKKVSETSEGVSRKLPYFLYSVIKGITDTVVDVAKEVADIGDDVITDVVETAKVVGSPIQQITVGVYSKACNLLKSVVKNMYKDIGGLLEPNLENLKISLMTSWGLTTHPISIAHRTILRRNLFDPTKKTVLFIHGFTDDPTGRSFTTVSNAFMIKGGYNILALDGSSLIKWLYLRCTTYVRFMGEKLGKLLAKIVNSGVPRQNILLIGHSLGAHIAGFTGQMFANITGKKLTRISSLDPAGPCFVKLNDNLRISKDDAEFVDVIHTNAGVFGLKENVGHVDFYPNGGSTQPGCLLPTCEHSRAWEFYANSVTNPTSLIARECDDWKQFVINKCENSSTSFSLMGFSVDPEARGVFYIRTNDEYPFGLGKKGLEGPDRSISIAQQLALQGTSKFADILG